MLKNVIFILLLIPSFAFAESVDLRGYASSILTADSVQTTSKLDTNAYSTNYQFRMCNIKDVRTNQIIVGQKFSVFSNVGATQIVVVDASSCVYFGYTVHQLVDESKFEFIFRNDSGVRAFIHKKFEAAN